MYHKTAEYLLEAAPTTSATTPQDSRAPWMRKIDEYLSKHKDMKDKYLVILIQLIPRFNKAKVERRHSFAHIAFDVLNDVRRAKRSYNSAQALYDDLVKLNEDRKGDRSLEGELVRYSQKFDDMYSDVEVADAEQSNNEVEKWEKYSEFRKTMYAETVRAGWPVTLSTEVQDDSGEAKEVTISKDELWNKTAKTPYIFSSFAPDFLQKKTIAIKESLFKKFKKDPEGLRRLDSKVNKIVEHEKTYFKKESTFLNIIGAMSMFVFQGLGGQERDLAMFSWLKQKFKKLTIFQYQQLVIEDVKSRLDITDETAATLKKMLLATYNAVKKECDRSKGGIVEPIKTSRGYDGELTAYFLVKPRTAAQVLTNIYSLMLSLMQGFDYKQVQGENGVIMRFVQSVNASTRFSAGPSEQKIKELCAKGREKLENIGEQLDKHPLVFELDNVDEKNKLIGAYIWEISLGPKYVKFMLSYESRRSE